jgi:hypothetical protein
MSMVSPRERLATWKGPEPRPFDLRSPNCSTASLATMAVRMLPNSLIV